MSDEQSTSSESSSPNSTSVSWSTRWRRLSLVQYLPLKFRRYAGRLVLAGVALIAAVLGSVVTVDLGPAVRAQAERAASTQLDRPASRPRELAVWGLHRPSRRLFSSA